jgi:multiple sugar transport system permease protein
MAQRAVAPGYRTAPRRPRLRRALIEHLQGWLFASPWLIGLVVFFLAPMLWSIWLSFTSYDIVQAPHFIGVGNYAEILADPLIWQSLKVTTLFAIISVPFNLGLGLAIALLLNQKVRGIAVWRTIFYLPSVISGVAVALLWEWLLNGRFGLINYALYALFGITGPDWLADEHSALFAFILMSAWTIGGSMLINLAALQGVPTALYEAAAIDGATAWQRFRHITVPTISAVIFFNLIIGIIGALQSFTLFFVMTDGGPNNSTLTFMLYLYNIAFQNLRMGYGSAMAWLLFVYLAVLTALVFRSSSRWVHYESPKR